MKNSSWSAYNYCKKHNEYCHIDLMFPKRSIAKMLLYSLWKDYNYCEKHNEHWNKCKDNV